MTIKLSEIYIISSSEILFECFLNEEITEELFLSGVLYFLYFFPVAKFSLHYCELMIQITLIV